MQRCAVILVWGVDVGPALEQRARGVNLTAAACPVQGAGVALVARVDVGSGRGEGGDGVGVTARRGVMQRGGHLGVAARRPAPEAEEGLQRTHGTVLGREVERPCARQGVHRRVDRLGGGGARLRTCVEEEEEERVESSEGRAEQGDGGSFSRVVARWGEGVGGVLRHVYLATSASQQKKKKKC